MVQWWGLGIHYLHGVVVQWWGLEFFIAVGIVVQWWRGTLVQGVKHAFAAWCSGGAWDSCKGIKHAFAAWHLWWGLGIC